MNTELKKLYEILNNKSNIKVDNYYIPKIWNEFNYVPLENKDNLLRVNPYDFYASALSYIMNNPKPCIDDYNKAYYYSSMIRTNTTFDHDQSKKIEIINNDGFLETGSFIKMIAYLPTLKKIGINVMYLLPIMQFSQLDRKGELGSVYGVSNFFKIDSSLYDPITKDELTLEEQFKAFVQACHLCGMKVILDIIPRTNSVNSDFIITNPEWFYWIDLKDLDTYAPPLIKDIKKGPVPISDKNLEIVLKDSNVLKHLSKFKQAPNLIDPILWGEVVERFNKKEDEALNLIRKYFKMSIAPAFSDNINDNQPAWSDVTFFRMYLDHPTLSQSYLKEDYHPYILFDSIKSNLFPGNKPNMPLWNTLADILPYYIKEYGIDGSRIDMGHALPLDLTKMIISKARDINKDFYFIAEELNSENANKAKQLGYDLIIGDGFYHTHRIKQQLTRDFYYKACQNELLMFGSGETHDTPRIISRENDIKTLVLVSCLNMFTNNLVPFINSGQELLERQPMNTGIDCDENSHKILDKNDPYYMKLALFDIYQFHYDNNNSTFYNQLIELNNIRTKYIDYIINKDNLNYITYSNKHQMLMKYKINNNENLIIIANASLDKTYDFNKYISNNYELLFTTNKTPLILNDCDIQIIIERV